MRYKFFTSSEGAWTAMFQAVRGATHSVYLETYIFEDNLEDFNFLELLKEKAKAGVVVKLISDSFGSFYLSQKSVNGLRESGVEVFFLSYFLHRMHRKILVVDDTVAFVGGVNFQRMSKSWNDLVLRVNGGKLANSLLRSFAKSYASAGGEDKTVLAKRKQGKGDPQNKIWEHFPEKNKFTLKKIYQKHLAKAEKNILLVTPYFFPKRWLTGALHQAVLRGVEVEVLVPKTTNHFSMDRANYFFMYKLSALGVKFYLEGEMNHAKVMLIDNVEGLMGSNNLDFFSFDLNSEVGVFTKDPKIVRKILEIAAVWRKGAVLFDRKLFKMKWYDYIISPIIALFAKIF